MLGPIEVWASGRPVDVGAARQRAVLAALAVDVGRPVRPESLLDRVWGERLPLRAQHSLHVYISRIRQALETSGAAGAVVRRSGGYLLNLPIEAVDCSHFRSLVRQASQSDVDPAERIPLLTHALALWHGEPLAGLPGDWAARERQAWQRQRIDATLRWAAAKLVVGDVTDVIESLSFLAEEQPLDERVAAQLIRALAAGGRRAQALGHFAAVRRKLAEELGTDPGAELGQLHRALLRGEVDAAEPVTPPVPAARPAPAQLPMDIRAFTGRQAELALLDEALPAQDGRLTVPIHVVTGAAGIGKTALAVHWAHRAAPHFPDGALYVDLEGFGPDGVQRAADHVVRDFLVALGVDGRSMPADHPAQAALYRGLLADRRMLVLLDNARDAGHVRPMLPGAESCLVLVTSRNPLTSLVAAEGAQPLPLELLSAVEAGNLLRGRIGRRAAAEPGAVDQLADLCGRLPLALTVVAARVLTQPRLTLGALVAELRGARPLDALDGGDEVSNVRSALSWSYSLLSAGSRRLLRQAAALPGAEFSVLAAVSLTGSNERSVRRWLAELTDAQLLFTSALDRFSMHDLVRTFALEMAAVDPEPERTEALLRWLDHQLHSAYAAATVLHPHWDSIEVAHHRAGVVPAFLACYDDAMAWFAAERQVLTAAVRRCANLGLDTYAWQLAWAMTTYLDRQGYWHDQVSVQADGLRAAIRSDDTVGQAHTHRTLARAHTRLGRLDDVEERLLLSADLFGAFGDLPGQAHAHLDLAEAADRQGRAADVEGHTQRALTLYRKAGHRYGQAMALNAMGWYRAQRGEHEAAIEACREALTLLQQFGDRHGEAATWDSLGYAQHRHADVDAAIASYRHAISLYRQFGDRYYEADTLSHLAEAFATANDPLSARQHWRAALRILEDLDHPDADRVRAQLT